MLGCFSVGASAADEASGNLVDPNLLNWTSDNFTYISYRNGIGRLYCTPADVSSGTTVQFKLNGCYDLPSLNVGHSYTASLHFPSVSEINTALGTSLTDNDLLLTINKANTSIKFGVGYKKLSHILTIDEYCYEIKGSDFSSYLGRTVSFDFDYSTKSSTGTPIFYIVIRTLDADTDTHILYVSNPVLKDNDADNTEGFFNNLIEFLRTQFGGISVGLDDLGIALGDKLSDVLSGLINKLTDVRDKINSKLDTVKEGIADTIFEAFDAMGIDLEGWFNNVGSWFTDLKNKLTENIEAFKTAITEFFDKFKPRVYEELYWERGMVNGSNGSVFIQPTNQNVIVSELFEVPLGTQYNFDFIDSDLNGAFQIYQYSMDGTFIGSYGLFSTSVEEHILPQGYSYRFRLVLKLPTHPSAANNIVKIYADEGWLNALVRLLIYKIRGLFVPDPYFISDWSETYDAFLAEHLGIVYDAGTLTSDFIQKLGDLLSRHIDDDILFTLPEVKISLPDDEFVLWEEQSINLTFLETNSFFAMFYGLYKMILWVIFIFATIKHAIRTWERIIGA